MGCVDGAFLMLINILPAFVTTATLVNTPAHSMSPYYSSIHAMYLSPYLPSYYIYATATPPTHYPQLSCKSTVVLGLVAKL